MIYVRLLGEELEWMCAIAGPRAVAIKQRVSIPLEGGAPRFIRHHSSESAATGSGCDSE